MAQKHIVVANEPYLYRAVIATSLRIQRPDAVVSLLDPDDVAIALMQCRPSLVVCSRFDVVVPAHAAAWLVLYPEGSQSVWVQIGDSKLEEMDLDFDMLLALIDDSISYCICGTRRSCI